MIETKNISKSYGALTALSEFSHDFKNGKITVIIGPSGCGKSTLIRLITGLTKPDSGIIKIEGAKISDSNINSLRLNMGYVIQEGGLFPHLNVRDNVTLGAQYQNWSSTKTRERYNYLLQLTKLTDDNTGKYPQELSGGQRQRVSLMRALMLDPAILVFDEPLGALDPLIRFDLQKDLKHIFTSLQKTVLLVTHDLNEALYFADEIILMNNGSIEQVGSPADLTENPKNSFVKKFVAAQRIPGNEN